MRNGQIIDTLTSFDNCEIVKTGEKKLNFTKVLFKEKALRYHQLENRKNIEKLFAIRQKYKDEGNDLMQGFSQINHEQSLWSSNTQRHR